MAFNWYNTSGQPSDSTGSDGDWARDASAKIDYGPKGNVTPGSWAQTANSLTGATGAPLQGFSGAPPSTFGVNGQGAIDLTAGVTYLKSSNAWSQVGQIVGVAGPSNLGSTGLSYGPIPQASGITVSSTATTLPGAPGGSTPCVYAPVFASNFMGVYVQSFNTGTTTFTLYDQTAGSPVYTITCGANTVASSGSSPFAVGTYPLTQAHQYVWQITNPTSQTGGGIVYPIYTMPSASASPAVCMYPLIGYASSTSITSTVTTLPLYGGTNQYIYYPIRTAGCYATVATLTATGSTATTATATLNGYYRQGTNTGNNFTWSPSTLTANGNPKTVFFSSTDTSTFATGYNFYYGISASTTITATLTVQIYGYI